MREMGLEAIAPGPNLSKRNHEHKVYPYLLRNVEASYPNHVWGIDITYLPLRKSWAYLVAVIDWPGTRVRVAVRCELGSKRNFGTTLRNTSS